ncbi:MAG: phosphate acyltransferase PlsX [Ignavibacteriaceae bacterium]|nr:phosphate acyltransferase PlsX [Ignavibacteriaceae bacterium]
MSSSPNSVCRVVLDAMGGDYAPKNVLIGAAMALKETNNLDLILVGDKAQIIKVASENGLTFPEDKIVHTTQVIEMTESPAEAVRAKTDSSIVVGSYMVREGKADAFVSAGHTGAMMTASTLIMGRIKGVERPTIGTLMPCVGGVCGIFDAGANVDSKPKHLVEHAILGSLFMEEIRGINRPRVGVLSIGEEENKGNEVSKKTYEMLKSVKDINFVGNVEGKDILKGNVDVVVCDGFVGNIVLKFAEGVIILLKHLFKDYASKSLMNKIKMGLLRSSLKDIFSVLNYETYGGVPLLGVKGISIIGHGSSSPLAIKNMILQAEKMHKSDLVLKTSNSLKEFVANFPKGTENE